MKVKVDCYATVKENLCKVSVALDEQYFDNGKIDLRGIQFLNDHGYIFLPSFKA